MRQQLGSLREAALDHCATAVPLVDRLWDHDARVWPGTAGEDAHGSVRDRVGWLDAIDHTRGHLAAIERLVDQVAAEGLTDVLVVGMGGAVVATQALASLVERPRLALHLLDSTHPDAVARARAELDPERWLVVVVSKSGTTVETRALFDRLHADLVAARGHRDAGRQVVVLTDPGSPLEAVARQREVRAIVSTNPRLGGRWSALDVIGMLPAALVGTDVARLLDRAAPTLAQARSSDLAINTPARLGAILAAAADADRHHLVLVLPPHLAGYGRWIAQLVGESLVDPGDPGSGLVPEVVHHVEEPVQYGPDVLVVAWGEWPGLHGVADHGVPTVVLDEPGPGSLAGGFFRWEFATAIAAALRGIDPFVHATGAVEAATLDVLASGRALPSPRSATDLLDRIDDVDRLVLLAWVDPGGTMVEEVRAAATLLRRRFGIPVLVELQPRAVHTTSRLHVHGPPGGLYVALVQEPVEDVARVDADGGFARLVAAQATAELEVLAAAGRPAGLVDLADLVEA